MPVVTVATAAPGFAASTDAPVIGSPSAIGRCKQPGDPNGQNCQGYRLSVNFTVQPSDPWTIRFTKVVLNGVDYTLTTSPRTFTVTNSAPQTSFLVCSQDDSAAGVVLTLEWTATNQRTGVTTAGPVTYDLGNLRPCSDK